MKTKLAKIVVGKATKYKRVKFAPAQIVAMYRAGKCVAEIALAIGYPANHGNNRVRRILMKAGVYRKAA
jgi:hypothetical protein